MTTYKQHQSDSNAPVTVTGGDHVIYVDPLVDARVDLRDFPFMPLDAARLRDSDLAATASGDAFRAAVLLWCAAWHQVPAASLPDDDAVLAVLAGYGRGAACVTAWREVRSVALRGFVLCSDGRLYHPVIAGKAAEAWKRKGEMRQARKASAERVAEYRRRRQNGNANTGVTGDDEKRAHEPNADAARNAAETDLNRQGQGQGQGEGQIITERANALSGECESNREGNPQPEKNKSRYAAAFLDFWAAYPRKVGKDAALRAWRNAKARHGPDAVQIIQTNAEALAASSRGMDERWIPHPSTWLNEGRFLDPKQETAKSVADWKSQPINRMVNPAGG